LAEDLIVKTYRNALFEVQNRLRDREPFAFSRYGDGELRILMGQVNYYPEFKYVPDDPAYVFLRDRLLDSFVYKSDSYYVGISCPKCVGKEKFLWAKQKCGQRERQLTWATLFVNSNYNYFKEHVVPIFAEYEVVMVCGRSANLDALPFPVARDCRVGHDAWKEDYHLAHRLAELISREKIRGALFLLCAGPFSNILAHQLHVRSSENTYLDVGSTLDPYFFGARGLTRRYLRGEARFLQETCIWN
jgi:hypothetical protein